MILEIVPFALAISIYLIASTFVKYKNAAWLIAGMFGTPGSDSGVRLDLWVFAVFLLFSWPMVYVRNLWRFKELIFLSGFSGGDDMVSALIKCLAILNPWIVNLYANAFIVGFVLSGDLLPWGQNQ